MNYGKERNLKWPWHNSLFIVHPSTKGFSLVETLFYVIILSFSLFVVSETVLVMVRSVKNLHADERAAQDGAAVLSRIAREIHNADSITDAESSFAVHPGRLLLHTTDAVGAARTVEFYVSSGALMLRENGVLAGALTGAETSVKNLVFRKIVTPRSIGVKTELTIQGAASTTRAFYTTSVLRNSY